VNLASLFNFAACILFMQCLLSSCSRETDTNKNSLNSNSIHFAYSDLPSDLSNKWTNSPPLMDTKKIFQSVTTGPDQDRAAIPHFIIGYWDVFAETPLSDKSLLRLVFKENGSHPPNSMLFYPEFSSLYESRADSTNYAKTIEKFTRFCSARVVDLDLSNAIVPKWYYSRISEFSRLQSLRISHKSIDLTTALPLPDSLTCINLVDFPFDTVLLDFIRDIDGLSKVILTRCYSSQATAPVTKINYDKFEDWIRITAVPQDGKV
jgi:hypothetical protein